MFSLYSIYTNFLKPIIDAYELSYLFSYRGAATHEAQLYAKVLYEAKESLKAEIKKARITEILHCKYGS